MVTNLPMIFSAGVFHSRNMFSDQVKYPEGSVSHLRVVTSYELELFLHDDGITYLNGRAYLRQRGALLIAEPGNKRQSALHFETIFLHFSCTDPAVMAMIHSVSGFHTGLDYEVAARALQDISETAMSFAPDSEVLAAGKLLTFLCSVKKECRLVMVDSGVASGHSVVSEAVDFMRQHYMDPLTVDQIADHCCLSTPHFHKVFYASVHMTPNSYLTKVRLSHAKLLLSSTNMSISEIAMRCGFNSQAYFSDRFKKAFAISPREYRDTSVPV